MCIDTHGLRKSLLLVDGWFEDFQGLKHLQVPGVRRQSVPAWWDGELDDGHSASLGGGGPEGEGKDADEEEETGEDAEGVLKSDGF